MSLLKTSEKIIFFGFTTSTKCGLWIFDEKNEFFTFRDGTIVF